MGDKLVKYKFPFKLLIAILVLAERILRHRFDRTYWLALRRLLCFWRQMAITTSAQCYLLALSITFTGELDFATFFFLKLGTIPFYKISLQEILIWLLT